MIKREVELHNGLIVNDLHIGGGGKADDFMYQSMAFIRLMRMCLRKEIPLILDGDIFELGQFRPDEIRARWGAVFDLMRQLHDAGLLFYICGNHDLDPSIMCDFSNAVHDHLYINTGVSNILVEHGHRVDSMNAKPGAWHHVGLWLLRKVEGRFPDIDVRYNRSASRKRAVKAEDLKFAGAARMLLEDDDSLDLVVFGHTHRPQDVTFKIAGPDGMVKRTARYMNAGCWTGKDLRVIVFRGDKFYLEKLKEVVS